VSSVMTMNLRPAGSSSLNSSGNMSSTPALCPRIMLKMWSLVAVQNATSPLLPSTRAVIYTGFNCFALELTFVRFVILFPMATPEIISVGWATFK
jgi:hypothetical protein